MRWVVEVCGGDNCGFCDGCDDDDGDICEDSEKNFGDVR